MKQEIKKYLSIIIVMFMLLIILITQNSILKRNEKNAIETLNRYKAESEELKAEVARLNSYAQKIEGEKLDWKLLLINYENPVPEDYYIDLANYDASRQFDSRAIDFLKVMLKVAKAEGAGDMWAQSTYRSYSVQDGLFKNKVAKLVASGYSKEEAEVLAQKSVNKPGYSEHNIGLAVDFNNVDYNFENTKGYKWLLENAEDYGFILRYKEEKKDITNVKFEPWHWRYVGIDNAKAMNELDMCLEEYVEYVKAQIGA